MEMTLIVARRLDDVYSGSGNYLLNFLRLVREAGYRVTIVVAPERSFGNQAWAKIDPAFEALADDIVWPRTVSAAGRYVSTAPAVWVRTMWRVAWAAANRLRGKKNERPLSLLGVDLTDEEAERTCAAVNAVGAQAIVAEYSTLGPLLDRIKGSRKFLFMHDSFALRSQTFKAAGLPLDHIDLSIEAEVERCRPADVIVHASNDERHRFEEWLPEREHVWMRPPYRAAAAGDDDDVPSAVFIGAVHEGNIRALDLIRREIWPKAKTARPDARLKLIGSICSLVNADEAAAEGVQLLGRVDDLSSVCNGSTIGLAPIEVGSGIPIKVVDYLSLGMPTIALSRVMQPFGDALNGIVIDAENPDVFAEKLRELLLDDQKRHATAERSGLAKTALSNEELFVSLGAPGRLSADS